MKWRYALAAAMSLLVGACSPTRIAGWLTPRAGAEERVGLRYAEGPRGLLDLTLPAGATAATPLIVFFYGGGWQSGARRDYAFLARALAAEGYAVAIPDYRVWPDGRWPDFVQDGAAAVAWLRRAEGVPRGPMFVMGHSAGGFIAASLALDPRWLSEAGVAGGRGALAGGVLLSAPIAWQPRDEPNLSIFAGAPGGRIMAVPDAAALRGAPPLLLVHGLADTVVGPFHARDLARDLAAAGGEATLSLHEGMAHLGPVVALSVPGRRFGLATDAVWADVMRFLNAHR